MEYKGVHITLFDKGQSERWPNRSGWYCETNGKEYWVNVDKPLSEILDILKQNAMETLEGVYGL